MCAARSLPHTPQRFHYARLSVAPLEGTQTQPVDKVTLLQLLDRVCQEWFGTMGGPGGVGEIEVVHLQESASGAGGAAGVLDAVGGGRAREAVIRFPAGATPTLLTALPLSLPSLSGQTYRLSILSDSADLQRVSVGPAARGRAGYRAWAGELKSGREGGRVRG
ncbi:hypothetical protein JCM10207_000798 [Rhodosporidiobolus poonsookiae]